jgi:hypothetical protein
MPSLTLVKNTDRAAPRAKPGADNAVQELLAPLPFHEKLKKIDGLKSAKQATRMAAEIVGTDLEHRVVLGAFLLQVQKMGLYKPATFSDWIMDNMGMQLRRAEYYLKVSKFILQAEIPGEKLARLNWSQCRVLASRIEPSDLTIWSELARDASIPQFEAFFWQSQSTDPQQFFEWIKDGAAPPALALAFIADQDQSREDPDEDGASGPQLLADIKDIFSKRNDDRIASNALSTALALMEDRPWREWHQGQPITSVNSRKYFPGGPFVRKVQSINLRLATSGGKTLGLQKPPTPHIRRRLKSRS